MKKRVGILAIVQARMGSTRLPGKILLDIQGQPLLLHVINRLKKSRLIDRIVVATTTKKSDDKTAEFCRSHRIAYYRGQEHDVLGRFYRAARVYKAEAIVRITADCPLIDPKITDKVIKYYLDNISKVDYVANCLEPSYPRGLDTEVFSFRALQRAYLEAKKIYQREHVTPYIYEHPEVFKLKNIANDKDLSFLRLTVDEKNDFRLIGEIYRRLYMKKKIFLLKDILGLFKEEPRLFRINADVKQKKLEK